MNVTVLALNEINFELASKYIDAGLCLPSFERLIKSGLILTDAEKNYDELEPWIQWPSVHTGLPFADHKMFRLGDVVFSEVAQLFETVEDMGFSVGALSPMNAGNKMRSPSYFVPDPWTDTPSDPTIMSRVLAASLKQAVNDNSRQRLTIRTVLSLVSVFVAQVRPSAYPKLLKLVLTSKSKPWRRALFLDLFLYEIHRKLRSSKQPNLAWLFLNAGAHIQHHYMLNSSVIDTKEAKNPAWYCPPEEDPVSEMLIIYDEILNAELKACEQLIIATGLSQAPYLSPVFYYRLRDHKQFLKQLEIDFVEVQPRMTRDFLVRFRNEKDALSAHEKLSRLKSSDGEVIFGELELRSNELFAVLTWSKPIDSPDTLQIGAKSIRLVDHFVFVAIKNGGHVSKGYAYFSEQIQGYAPVSGEHVGALHRSIMSIFESELPRAAQ